VLLRSSAVEHAARYITFWSIIIRAVKEICTLYRASVIIECIYLTEAASYVYVVSVTSLTSVSSGAATEGVAVFLRKKTDDLFSHRPLKSDDLSSYPLVITPTLSGRQHTVTVVFVCRVYNTFTYLLWRDRRSDYFEVVNYTIKAMSTNLHCNELMQTADTHRLILHTSQSPAWYSSFISATTFYHVEQTFRTIYRSMPMELDVFEIFEISNYRKQFTEASHHDEWMWAISRACQFTQPMSIADARLHSSAAVGWQRCYLTLPQRLSISFVNKLKLVKWITEINLNP